jgi:hypothetical protein
MKHIALLIIILSASHRLYAQIWDDFSDAELHTHPTWEGDVDSFAVNADGQLQLNGKGAGSSYIATPATMPPADREWRFYIRENFAPSANNFARFYLMSDTSRLKTTALNGYYLQFGEAGGRDAVRFYRQTGSSSVLLCSLPDSLIAAAFRIRVKVVRTKEGTWTLFCSSQNSDMLSYTVQCVDTVIRTMTYTGILCQYTTSNKDKFFFDDIYYGSPVVDTVPPTLREVVLDSLDNAQLLLTLSESTDSSALDRQNYDLHPEIGNPLTAAFVDADQKQVQLRFWQPVPKNTQLSLHISHIKDISGNTLTDTAVDLLFAEPSLFDIVITEIMADPTPAVGLPPAEYIEIKNRQPYSLTLNGWTLQTGNYRRSIHPVLLHGYEHAIICSAADTALFSAYGKTTFTSAMQITDAGQNIALYDEKNNLIHRIDFTSEWHESPQKKDGGWSLEMIDTDNPCGQADNWTSCTASEGGTPGRQNAVSRSHPDMSAPQITVVASETNFVIAVHFSEAILPKYLQSLHAFRVEPHIPIDSILSLSENMQTVRLRLGSPLQFGTVYNLIVADTLADCAGNAIPVRSSFAFGLAQKARQNEVIINEVLFNPKEEGVDFVEIYNRSSQIIDLSTIRLSSLKSNGSTDTGKVISATGKQLFPQQYLVLTTRPDIVCSQYHCPYPENLLQMPALPAYANTGGSVVILSGEEVSDRFDYHEKMHYPLYKSVQGVSLERIHFDSPTSEAYNWHSAASTAGYATPGYRNSSYCEDIRPQSMFACVPEIFSPDADGFDDILTLSYSFPQPGYRVSVDVYNANGIKIRTLVNNEPVATEGYFTWDGVMEGNIKAPIGTYILLIRYWNPEGKTASAKKTCTVASKK